jgi:hypothetical protein
MKKYRYILIILISTVCYFTPTSHCSAELLVLDWEVAGDNAITRDTTTGLDWLDLTATVGRSFNDVSRNLYLGGDFECFRHATSADVVSLLTSVGWPVTGSNIFHPDAYQPLSWLQSLVGVTRDLGFMLESHGTTANIVSGTRDGVSVYVETRSLVGLTQTGSGLGDDKASDVSGHWLVRTECVAAPSTPVVISGTIKTVDDAGICAMVLASGQYQFSCKPIGEYSLTNLLRDKDGRVKRQIYADGFLPMIEIMLDSSEEAVVMTRSGSCPNYNTTPNPAFRPDSAGKRINISGKVLLQGGQTPICAMVLANGQYMFTCDGTGNYALNIPLDPNGQFKLQAYADGFAPTIQTFDESSANNDVRMARALECQ